MSGNTSLCSKFWNSALIIIGIMVSLLLPEAWPKIVHYGIGTFGAGGFAGVWGIPDPCSY
jgi:hypothetical protein